MGLTKVKPIKPGPGQESVWDYPRPPRLEPVKETVKVVLNGQVIAQSQNAMRVLETSHPPVYYIPPEDVVPGALVEAGHSTFCEFKGRAAYYHVVANGQKEGHAAWCYPEPAPAFKAMRNYVAFYPSRMEACFVGNERVQAQEGDFYGGWITSKIVGPFKGGAGTWGW